MPRKHQINYQGREWSLSDLAREYRLHPNTLSARLRNGMSVEEALAKKVSTKADAGSRGLAAGWAAKRRLKPRN